jgi:hypothetical protein
MCLTPLLMDKLFRFLVYFPYSEEASIAGATSNGFLTSIQSFGLVPTIASNTTKTIGITGDMRTNNNTTTANR